jgi:hypothetical protein
MCFQVGTLSKITTKLIEYSRGLISLKGIHSQQISAGNTRERRGQCVRNVVDGVEQCSKAGEEEMAWKPGFAPGKEKHPRSSWEERKLCGFPAV